ncbi:MAG: DMT family transporter [Trueperaceae bacterium]|nr:DMT family transporter [Trueperaceae bacterium]
MPLPAFLALLGVAVLWGSAFPLIKVGLEGLSVPHLTVARHLVASVAFVPFLLLTGARLRPEPRDVPWFLLLGGTGIFVYHTALNAGELRVSAGATSLIIASAPAITALLARWITGERMPVIGWLGSLTSFAGVALIVLGDSASLRFDPFAGFVLLSAFATSLYFVLQRRMFARYKAVEVTAFVTWGGTVPMLAFLPGLPADLMDAPLRSLLAAGYIGLFPSAVAYSLFAFAQSRAPTTQVTAMLYSVPVFSLTLSWWFLGEVPSLLTIIGGAIAIGGIVVVQRARRRAIRGPVPRG